MLQATNTVTIDNTNIRTLFGKYKDLSIAVETYTEPNKPIEKRYVVFNEL